MTEENKSFFSGEEVDNLLGGLEKSESADAAGAEQVVVKLDLNKEERDAAMLLLARGVLTLEELKENPEQASALVRERMKK